MRRIARILVTTAVLTSLSASVACSKDATSQSQTTSSTGSAWTAYATRFVEEYFRAQPSFAVVSGRHEYDGKLPDWSADGLRAEGARLERLRQEAERFSPESLEPAQQLEREHVLAIADSDLFWLRKAEAPFKNPAWYLGALDPDVYLSREYAPLERRMRAYIAYARTVPVALTQLRANMRAPLARTLVDRAVSGFGGFVDFYRTDVPKLFAAVKDEALQREFAAANEAAAVAMADMTKYFESLRPGATVASSSRA